ncbi:MAG: diacylglycerol kinase [Patescibacteria group bacterium]|nr:diacylglycerol kinase [Patescibacteria group bacterium]
MVEKFKYGFGGLKYFLLKDKSVQIQFIIAIIVIAVSLILKINNTELFIILMLCGNVIALEMINSAIEMISDIIDSNHNTKIKQIKDCAAGFVLIMSIITLIIGLWILVPYILEIFLN